MSWTVIDPEELDFEARRIDTVFWATVLDTNEQLSKRFPRRSDKVVGGDLFNSLYHWDPVIKDDPPDPATAEFIKQLMDRTAFKQLREHTVGDRNLAAAGAIRLHQELMRPQESDYKTLTDLKNQMDVFQATSAVTGQDNPAVDAIKGAMQALADNWKEKGVIQVGDMSANRFAHKSEAEQLQQVKSEQLDQALTNTTDDLEAAEELSEMDMSSGQGVGGPATERVLANLVDEKLIASVMKQDKLRKALKIAGRMRIIVQAERSRKPRPAPSPVELTYGSDLLSLLAQEWMLFDDPDTEDLFFQKYLDNGLLQYDKKEKPREGKGPFICLVDVSGSMAGNPEIYAVAAFTAMARLALQQKRKVGLIHFASYASRIREVEDSSSLIKALQVPGKLGGGTDFYSPLETAFKYIIDQRRFKKADIWLITDGMSSMHSVEAKQIQKWKTDTEARIFGTLIGRRAGRGRNPWHPVIQEFLDADMSIDSAGDLRELEWFKQMAKEQV